MTPTWDINVNVQAWFCARCGLAYQRRDYAEACEKWHDANRVPPEDLTKWSLNTLQEPTKWVQNRPADEVVVNAALEAGEAPVMASDLPRSSLVKGKRGNEGYTIRPAVTTWTCDECGLEYLKHHQARACWLSHYFIGPFQPPGLKKKALNYGIQPGVLTKTSPSVLTQPPPTTTRLPTESEPSRTPPEERKEARTTAKTIVLGLGIGLYVLFAATTALFGGLDPLLGFIFLSIILVAVFASIRWLLRRRVSHTNSS